MNFHKNWLNHLDSDLSDNLVLVGLGGSRCYGTNTAESDTDWRGVLNLSLRWQLSPYRNFEQTSFKIPEENTEGVIWSLAKFFQLAANCNPNVIELLFLREDHYAVMTEAGATLITNRDLFLSQRAVYSFCGYATSQLKRIKGHKQWLLNPPQAAPTRADFGLPEIKPVSSQQLQAANKAVQKQVHVAAPWLLRANNAEREEFWSAVNATANLVTAANCWQEISNEADTKIATALGFDTDFIDYMQREASYRDACQSWNQYQTWVKQRNPARAALEAAHGYDTKHAMHLVRLLWMGRELVEKSELNVWREDAESLLHVRAGGWSYEELIDWAETQTDSIYQLVRNGKTQLPAKTNQAELEKLYLNLQELLRTTI